MDAKMVHHLSLVVKVHQHLQMACHHLYQTMVCLRTASHKTMVTSHQPITIKRQALMNIHTKNSKNSTIKLHPHHILIMTNPTGQTVIIIQIYLILCNVCSPIPVPSIVYQIRFPIPADPIQQARITVTTAQKVPSKGQNHFIKTLRQVAHF